MTGRPERTWSDRAAACKVADGGQSFPGELHRLDRVEDEGRGIGARVPRSAPLAADGIGGRRCP